MTRCALDSPGCRRRVFASSEGFNESPPSTPKDVSSPGSPSPRRPVSRGVGAARPGDPRGEVAGWCESDVGFQDAPFYPATVRGRAGWAVTWPGSPRRGRAEEDAQIVFQHRVLPG